MAWAQLRDLGAPRRFVDARLAAKRMRSTAARGCKPKPGITIHRSRAIPDQDRSLVAAVPVTSAARTLVDLADVLADERLAKAIHRAEILRVFDLDALDRARVRHRRGAGRLDRVLSTYAPEPHLLRSEAERRLKQLCTHHDLGQPWAGAGRAAAGDPPAPLVS